VNSSICLYIPCYNGAQFLPRVWKGICQQTLMPARVLLIDDGSSDDSVSIAESLGMEVVRHSKNCGLGAARNTALRTAAEPLIAALDADCVPEPGWMETLAGGLTESLAGVGGNLQEFHQDTQADRWRATHMEQHWGSTSTTAVPFIRGSNTLWRRELLLAAGGYDERCRTNGEDLALCAKLKQMNNQYAYVADARCWHLRTDTEESVLRTYWRWMRGKRPRLSWGLVPLELARRSRDAARFALADMCSHRWSLLSLDLRMPLACLRWDLAAMRERR
jgi:glycosyltransferase involved in cell wall biosynthesis